MRVMLVARLFYSGQTTHTVELARELARMGHRVSLLSHGRCHLAAWDYFSQALRRDGIESFRAPAPQDALAFAAKAKPDAVHVHSSDLLPLARQIAGEAGAPLIFTAHGLGTVREPLLREADRVIAVGPRVYQELCGAGLERVELIANGVDTDRFRPGNKARGLKVAYVSRVDASKRRGLYELIEAVAMIPGAQLVVASNERPSHPACSSAGWLWDVAPLLASSHVVAGTGRAIREGMASGCVGLVLGSAYGGIVSPAALAEGVGGALWFSGAEGAEPDRQAIRRDLVRLAQDELHRRALARWSREYACRHFSLSRMARQVVGVYQDAAGRRMAAP